MRTPTELLWAGAVIAPATVAYVAAARDGVPAASGLAGHALGVVGFLIMLFAWLGYSWRKRETRNGPGTLEQWLQAHVVAGMLGPYLILLHSAFRFRGLAGLVSLLTLVVVASGFVGRYIFTRLPRRAGFANLETRSLRSRLASLDELIAAAEVETTGTAAVAVRTHRRSVIQRLQETDAHEKHARHLAPARNRTALWWLLHVPLAGVMIALAIIHVAGALYYATLLR